MKSNAKSNKNTNRIIRMVRIIFALTCIGALIIGATLSAFNQELLGQYFMVAFTALLSLGITFIPDFISHKDIMVIPVTLQTFFTIFTFLAMFCGEILKFYDRFFWWDMMLHFASGIMFSIIGYMLFVSLNRDHEILQQLHPASVVLFAVFFSIASGALWEIFECTGDTYFGMNMQRWKSDLSPVEWTAMQNVSNASNPGLMDTMKDIVNDATGALLSILLLLPLIKLDNRYTKTNISTKQLAENTAFLLEKKKSKNENTHH